MGHLLYCSLGHGLLKRQLGFPGMNFLLRKGNSQCNTLDVHSNPYVPNTFMTCMVGVHVC